MGTLVATSRILAGEVRRSKFRTRCTSVFVWLLDSRTSRDIRRRAPSIVASFVCMMLGSVAQLLATSILALLRGSAARNRLSPYLVSHISASGCCSSFVPGIHQVPRLPIISATTVVRLMHSTFDLPSLVLKTGPLRQLPFSSYIALVLGNRDRRT